MNPNQVLKMYFALNKIAKGYETPDQIRKSSNIKYGLQYTECLEMAYENLQSEARLAIKGIRIKSLTK